VKLLRLVARHHTPARSQPAAHADGAVDDDPLEVVGRPSALEQHEITAAQRERAACCLDRPDDGPRHLRAARAAVGTFAELVDDAWMPLGANSV
jgi:hypothetical protein